MRWGRLSVAPLRRLPLPRPIAWRDAVRASFACTADCKAALTASRDSSFRLRRFGRSWSCLSLESAPVIRPHVCLLLLSLVNSALHQGPAAGLTGCVPRTCALPRSAGTPNPASGAGPTSRESFPLTQPTTRATGRKYSCTRTSLLAGCVLVAAIGAVGQCGPLPKTVRCVPGPLQLGQNLPADYCHHL